MKILFYGLNFAPEPVGIGKYSGEMAEWFASRGHQIRVITAPPYFPAWRVSVGYRNRYGIEHIDGVRVLRCPMWVPTRPTGFTRLLHLASFSFSSLVPLLAQLRWRPDVVFCVVPAFFCAPGSLLLGRLCGRSTITWLHIQDFELDAAFELGLLKGRILRTFAEALESKVLLGFDKISSISTAMVNKLSFKGVDPSRTSLLPNWVDLEMIRQEPFIARQDNVYRRELGIGPDQVVLMYSGSMNKKQGLELLVESIYQLSDLPNLVWLFAGEGPTKDDLVAATKGMSQVRHLSLQPKHRLNEWLSAADIHLLPQKAEAADLVLPSKLIGILASGRPLVATSPLGSELFFIANRAGFCVAPGDISAFTESLRKLISDVDLRFSLGTRARALAEDLFDKNFVLSRLESSIEDCIVSSL